MYAKILSDGTLWIAPEKILNANNEWVVSPTATDYLNAGYLPFEEGEKPTTPNGYHLEEIVSLTEDSITRNYILVENEISKPTDFERLEAQVMWTALITDTLIEG